jgi:rSAM/selenodomain-associated transferase 1
MRLLARLPARFCRDRGPRAYNKGMREKVYHDGGERVKTGRVLGVFARLPLPGQVKTRLAARTSAQWAARVAAAFLGDTLDRLGTMAGTRLLVFTPEDAGDHLASLAGDRFGLEAQGPGDLGRRLAHFFGCHLEQGPVIVVGSDSPTLPVGFIEEAFARLDEADIVLGPATDGGYYLLGCRRLVPAQFTAIDWGGAQVLSQTVRRIPGELRLSLLPPWYDVDTLEDWHMLAGHLAALRRAGLDPQTPRTETLVLEGLP